MEHLLLTHVENDRICSADMHMEYSYAAFAAIHRDSRKNAFHAHAPFDLHLLAKGGRPLPEGGGLKSPGKGARSSLHALHGVGGTEIPAQMSMGAEGGMKLAGGSVGGRDDKLEIAQPSYSSQAPPESPADSPTNAQGERQGAKEKGARMVGQVDIDPTFENTFYINMCRERDVCIYV